MRRCAMKKISTVMALSAVVLLSACATDTSKQTVGTLVGAGAGALIGSQFGGGAGQVVGATVGAVGGGLLGNTIGKSMDDKEKK
jgi:uncharacterized protein YcfJ